MKRVFTKLMPLFLSFLLLLSVPAAVFAQRTTPEVSPTPMPVNSYELFWPMVAGKTVGEPLYFLKSFKETVRGWFIFGATQKADYQVFLGVKRVLEAEKLINQGKEERAITTLDKAIGELTNAQTNLKAVLDPMSVNVKQNISNRINNLDIYLPQFMKDKEGRVKKKLEEMAAIISSLKTDLGI